MTRDGGPGGGEPASTPRVGLLSPTNRDSRGSAFSLSRAVTSVSSLPFLPPIFHRPFVSSEVKIIRSFSLGLLLPRFFTSSGIYCHCAHDTKFVSLRCTFTFRLSKRSSTGPRSSKVATINRSFLGFTTKLVFNTITL